MTLRDRQTAKFRAYLDQLVEAGDHDGIAYLRELMDIVASVDAGPDLPSAILSHVARHCPWLMGHAEISARHFARVSERKAPAKRVRHVVKRLAEHPTMLDEWIALGERIVERNALSAPAATIGGQP